MTEVANRLGESPQCVNNWVSRGQVPVDKCSRLIVALDGAVEKSDLRPRDWSDIWPEETPA